MLSQMWHKQGLAIDTVLVYSVQDKHPVSQLTAYFATV